MNVSIERLRFWLLAGAGLLVIVIAGFLGYAHYRAHRFLRDLPQKLGVDVLFYALVAIVVGSTAFGWLGTLQRRGFDFTFWLGNQGLEFTSMGRILQVLTNLVGNALKFTPKGGRVTVGVESRTEEIWVTVSDTGVGIPADHLTQIFDRFFRVDKARSRSVGGTGLGLSIVKHVLERMNGRITVESELGKGSVFTVTLPSGNGN